MRYLSSQTYRNPSIIEHKRAAEDYEVQICIIPLGGEDVAIVVDGHHSYEAALLDGVAPEFEDASPDLCWYGEEMESVEEYLERIEQGSWYTLCER